MAAKGTEQRGSPLARDVIVGVAGAGTMGAGIAQVAAAAGHRVLLFDVRLGAAQMALDTLATTLKKAVAKGKLSHEKVEGILSGLSVASDLEALEPCGLVIEAIVEDLNAKRNLFARLESIVGPDTIFATNTSSISITAIAAAMRSPHRLGGLHFFNPAHAMPLVEVIHGIATSADVDRTLYLTAEAWGKVPVRARSTPGFIVNRVARPFYGEALRVLSEGAADCATIDAIMREAGAFRMGPFELMDLIGNDVNYAVTQSIFEAFYGDPRFKPSPLQRDLIDAAMLGRKTGRGFYDYREGATPTAAANASLTALPSIVEIFGEEPLAKLLVARLTASGVSFRHLPAYDDGRIAAGNFFVLFETDGRTATCRAAKTKIANTVLIDLAFEFTSASRVAIAAADQAEPAALTGAVGLLQAAGYTVSVIGDVPGMIVARTVAMLGNEAADAVQQGVCSAEDVDLAMRKGLNYPRGPIEWAEAVGLDKVLRVLEHLGHEYGEDRYRVSPLLRRKVLAGARFTSSGNEQRATELTRPQDTERNISTEGAPSYASSHQAESADVGLGGTR